MNDPDGLPPARTAGGRRQTADDRQHEAERTAKPVYTEMDENTTLRTPEAMDISRAGADDRAATWSKLGKLLVDLAAQRDIDHVKVLTAFFGSGSGITETVERIGNALYQRPDKLHIVFLGDTRSTNEHWTSGTLYVNIVVNPGIAEDDADTIYAAVLEEIVRATVVDTPCKIRWHRDDQVGDRVMAEIARPTPAAAPAPAS